MLEATKAAAATTLEAEKATSAAASQQAHRLAELIREFTRVHDREGVASKRHSLSPMKRGSQPLSSSTAALALASASAAARSAASRAGLGTPRSPRQSTWREAASFRSDEDDEEARGSSNFGCPSPFPLPLTPLPRLSASQAYSYEGLRKRLEEEKERVAHHLGAELAVAEEARRAEVEEMRFQHEREMHEVRERGAHLSTASESQLLLSTASESQLLSRRSLPCRP